MKETEQEKIQSYIDEQIEKKLQGARSQIDLINDYLENAKALLDRVNGMRSQAQELHQKYKEQEEDLLNNINNTQTEANEFYLKYKEQREDLLESISKAQTEANEFYLKYKEQVKTQMNKAEELLKTQNDKTEELHIKIEELLPGATTAGLATNYKTAQNNKGWRYFAYWLGFLASLAYMIAVLPFNIDIFPFNIFSFKFLIEETDLVWYHWIYRIIAISPVIWLAWYCQRNISQITRIQEEYHHKERVMRMYEGFMREVGKLPDDASIKGIDMQKRLLDTMIETIGKNPAEVLHPSETLIEANILTKLLKRNKSSPESADKKGE